MANVYKPGLLQVRPQWQPNPDDSRSPECVLWFLSGSLTPPDGANLIAIQTVFDVYFSAAWAVVGAGNQTYVGSEITDWSSDAGLASSSVGTFTPASGSGEGGTCPDQVAVLVSWGILLRWKGGHPRTYLPYIGISQLSSTDHNRIQPTVATDCFDALSDMQSEMVGSGVLGGQTQQIYRFRNDPVKAQLYELTGFTVNTELATQRRRIRLVTRR
jgi:hypothetical protein